MVRRPDASDLPEGIDVVRGDLTDPSTVAGMARVRARTSAQIGYGSTDRRFVTEPSGRLLARWPPSDGAVPIKRRELSEHDPVEDYDALKATPAPLRARGMRLAIDDVGAGFSSPRHIVLTSPDVMKLDRSIIDGGRRDPGPVVDAVGDPVAGGCPGCDGGFDVSGERHRKGAGGEERP